MQLFYCNEINGDFIELSSEESHHAIKVLRKQCGDVLNIIDGEGALFTASIIDNSPKKCLLKIVDKQENYNKLPYSLSIAVAPTKNIDRTEWFVEKATEIGVSGFTMLKCAHSERKVVNTERIEKVIMSAVKQSIKAYKPTLEGVTKFEDFVKQDFGGAELFIAHCSETFPRVHLKDLITGCGSGVIMIGPEGDFSDQEIQLAMDYGFKSISLGASRLRTETAALYAVTTYSLFNSK